MYKMLKSVTKMFNSYSVHTFGVLFKEVLPKFKTWTISVYKGVISVYKVLKSVCKVCNPHVGHTWCFSHKASKSASQV